MIEKKIVSETYYTFNGQAWPKFYSIEDVKRHAKRDIISSVKHVMGKLNGKVSGKRRVNSSYQTAAQFINGLSWDDMLEIRREINRQERQMKKIDKLS